MRSCVSLLLSFLFVWGNAQTVEIKGRITDVDQKPLGGVVVKIAKGDEMVGFATSGKDGHYECKLPQFEDSLTVSFRKLNYKERRETLYPGTKTFDITLERGAQQLREVVVKAPPVKALGDTVLYNLKSFLQSGDHSLEEGLKRLPGIKVNEVGIVSYMGRDISKFYIEGQNLLGGRYNLATQNIPAEKVTGVEVLRHHQANKVDKQELTDNVALNIKLSSKAKLKPFGTYEARLGYRPDKVLYGVGGTAMLFRKNLQVLGTLKLANDGRMGRNDLYDHFGQSSWQTSSEEALPLLSGSQPPMKETRYLDRSDELFSLNLLRKISEDDRLKVNANYSHRRAEHDYELVTQYPQGGGNNIAVDEQSDFIQKEHLADVQLNYRSDRDSRLLENNFSVRGRFADGKSDVWNGESPNLSKQSTDTYGILNTLSLIRRVKKWKLNFDSELRYADTPDNTLDMTQKSSSTGALFQKARSKTFNTKETFYTGYQLLPTLTLSIPVKATANANRLQTQWQGDTLALNALQGWDFGVSLSPQIEYQTRNRRLRATIGVPLAFLVQDYRNKARDLDWDFSKMYANWDFQLLYVPSGNVEWKFTSSLNQDFGDMMDLLTGPIQTDYRTIRTRSGIFGKNKSVRNAISFDWQEPLSFWHFSMDGSYVRGHSNVMSGQNASNEDLSLVEIARDNASDAISGSVSLSKYLYSIKTNLTADASYYWQQNKRLSQNLPVTTFGTGYYLMGRISTNPIEQIQANYLLSYQEDILRGDGSKSSSDRWAQELSIAYNPWKTFRLEMLGEWQRNSLLDNRKKSFSFLDAKIEYKFQKPKLLLRLSMNNLLNVRSYAYTAYNQLNTFNYNYRLNGREFLLSFILR